MTATLTALLDSRPYPGRGVLAAALGDGRLCLAYFLTGRSAASRERELAVLEGGDIAVRALGAGAADDALRHYVAAARRGDVVVLGNGSQVEPLAEALATGAEPLAAFSAHAYEPDPPIFTPRVWVTTSASAAHPAASEVTSAHTGQSGAAQVTFGSAAHSGLESGTGYTCAWRIAALPAGEGVLLSTYDGGVAEVSTASAPAAFTTAATTPDELLDETWAALDPQLRVAALSFLPTEPLSAALSRGNVA